MLTRRIDPSIRSILSPLGFICAAGKNLPKIPEDSLSFSLMIGSIRHNIICPICHNSAHRLHPPFFQDKNLVSHVFDHIALVRDEQISQSAISLQILEEAQHLGLD
ncbi:MAG: hypothetical protein A4E48_02300 [Methanosaeta sp. PtaU1.Bin060]|jgi:hypothetical protein|nr:MAG: hypothetical protein A4E48_02300 [Methanosaeta sp. PtaU1.Bin060]